jgi:hypothetical protein
LFDVILALTVSFFNAIRTDFEYSKLSFSCVLFRKISLSNRGTTFSFAKNSRSILFDFSEAGLTWSVWGFPIRPLETEIPESLRICSKAFVALFITSADAVSEVIKAAGIPK